MSGTHWLKACLLAKGGRFEQPMLIVKKISVIDSDCSKMFVKFHFYAKK